ncbi:hemagglutinin [Bifidobacterium goeldii]|nr:hemagglutinin [Bifidobacterium goeldii]
MTQSNKKNTSRTKRKSTRNRTVNRGKQSKRPHSTAKSRRSRKTRSFTRWWQHASLRTRLVSTLTALIATICVIALVWTLTDIVVQRIEIVQAQNRQSELVQTYNFDPGDIISDGQFFNAHAMSEAEVQAFLNEQGAQCSGTQCLKTRTFDTEDRAADQYCSAYKGAKGETAAAIIDKTARACKVSQKVLLTVLQKEQQLVTATHPSDFQFKAAMGLSCPDDASCDPQYAGFFNQVFGSAQRYRYYAAHESQYGYHAGQLNYIQYHPNASCGGSDVYITNTATALLYIYTPYQPNTAALAAGAGEGNSCSSYGNRNFAIIYQGWFGSAR